MCDDEPVPNEAKLTLPEFAFAYAMNSVRVFTLSAAGTTIKSGTIPICITGAKSRSVS